MTPNRLLAVALISAAMLAHEVLLIRLFAIIQWQQFAAMMISIALLGLGASGTFLACARRALLRRYDAVFAISATLFAVSAVAGFAVAARLPFNALEVVWQPAQLLWLAAEVLLLMPPFFCGGTCIGLAFARAPDRIGRIYACDLVGAGLGALGIVAVLFLVFPGKALALVAAVGLAAAAVAAIGLPRWRWIVAAALAVATVIVALRLPDGWTDPRPHMSPYKGLMTALNAPDARVVGERSSPLSLLSVVESPTIPFRHVPGLSLSSTQEPPAQLAVFTDGDAMTAITAWRGDPETIGYLDQTIAALPYHLRPHPRVALLDAGGGAPVLLALLHDAEAIDAVEVDPGLVSLVQETFAAFAGQLYQRPNVTAHLADPRGFVAGSRGSYDLILLPPFGASGPVGDSLAASTTYTVEAMRSYLAALAPDGLLAISGTVRLPPRGMLRLFATAVAALEAEGITDPGRHLALIRGWDSATLIVARTPLSAADIATVRAFAADRSFDLAWLPGMAPDEANRINRLDRPYFHDAAHALIGPDRAAFIAGYKFAIAPATDDRPYAFDFFRWRALPELIALHARGGAAMFDLGYLILLATLVQATVLGAILILAPLWFGRRPLRRAGGKARTALYFLALGLAFLFVEIAFIQRFQLFLGHPLYAVTVVLAGFLVFAGLGSAAAARWRAGPGRGSAVRGIALAAAAIAVTAAVYPAALPWLFDQLIVLPDAARIVIALALIAPLAFCMGLPFPLGLGLTGERAPALIPWAWAINGCASVASALLATLLAMHIGFTGVVITAIALYLAAPLMLGTRTSSD